MSPREKKLLIFFGAAGFILLNFFAFNFFNTKRLSVERERSNAELALKTAEMFRNSSEEVVDQMEWLAENEPEPSAPQDVQTELQQITEKQAKEKNLTIKSQKPLPIDSTSGVHYHRAKVQITLTGSEENLYKFFDSLNDPKQFRSATFIRLAPNSADDTLIDCTATIEQWFVPLIP